MAGRTRIPAVVALVVPGVVALAGCGGNAEAGNEPGVQTEATASVESADPDPAALEELRRVLDAPPSSPDAREALRARIAELEALRPRLPDHAPAAYALGSAYLDLAGLVGGQGPWYDLARAELEQAFALDPDDARIRAKLASFYAKIGRSEKSVELLVEGLEQHPDYADFHDQLGYVLRYAGLMQESMASYRRSQELDPAPGNLIATQDQITKSLIYLGEYDEALASHRRMLAFAADAGRPVDEKQWFYEGVIHLYRGDVDAAVDAFRSGARTDPTTVWTMFGHAYEAMALGDTARVADVLDQLVHRDVVDGERHYRLVHFSAFVGDVDRALGHLRQSTEGGFFNAPYLASDPWTGGVREHPEAQAMIRAAQARGDAIRAKLGR